MRMFDLTGKLCFESLMTQSHETIQLPAMNNGLYVCSLQLSNGTTLHFKLNVIQ